MTRPAGASFAQFFPAAPQAARDRAMERERAKMKAQDSPSSQAADVNGRRTPLAPAAFAQTDEHGSVHGTASKPRPNGTGPDAAHPATDETESILGDTPNAAGSASSRTSASSSSVSSAPTRPSVPAAMKSSTNQLTPPTTVDSPSSYLSAAAPAKTQSTTPHRVDGLHGSLPMPNGSAHDAPAAVSSVAERVPARDPSRPIQCIRCIYDPLLDTSLSSSEKRKTKPIYKEFGLVCTPETLTLRGERHLDRESFG